MMFLAIALWILGAYMTTMFFLAMDAERNIWLALLIAFWPIPAAIMFVVAMVSKFADWWEGN